MITVASVLKSGGSYDWAYVERLANGVHRNLAINHKFVCLSDVPYPGNFRESPVDRIIQLNHDWPGWWAKMELFGISGPVLCFDLDTIITGSIDHLANWVMNSKGQLMLLRGFYRDDRCSGILGWNGGISWILKNFIEQCQNGCRWQKSLSVISLTCNKERFRGDQDWLRFFLPKHPELSVVLVQDIFDEIFSYKVNVRKNGSLPDNAKIVCFHGRPRPHEVRPMPEWMRKHWMGEI